METEQKEVAVTPKKMRVQTMKRIVASSFDEIVMKGVINPVGKLDDIPYSWRLSLVQDSSKFVKKLSFGASKVSIPYIEGKVVKKMLHFVTNFSWGCEEILHQVFDEKTITKKWKDNQTGEERTKTMQEYSAYVICRFWFKDSQGDIQHHTSVGTKQSFENPATSKFTVLQMAQTNATKAFARDVFGIGADIQDAENKGYQELRKKVNTENWTDDSLEQSIDDGLPVDLSGFSTLNQTPDEQLQS